MTPMGLGSGKWTWLTDGLVMVAGCFMYSSVHFHGAKLINKCP